MCKLRGNKHTWIDSINMKQRKWWTTYIYIYMNQRHVSMHEAHMNVQVRGLSKHEWTAHKQTWITHECASSRNKQTWIDSNIWSKGNDGQHIYEAKATMDSIYMNGQHIYEWTTYKNIWSTYEWASSWTKQTWIAVMNRDLHRDNGQANEPQSILWATTKVIHRLRDKNRGRNSGVSPLAAHKTVDHHSKHSSLTYNRYGKWASIAK